MSNVLPSQEDRVTIPRMTTMGFIVRSEGGYYFVRLEDGIVVRSTIRGRLRQQRSEDTAFLTLGDRVILTWSTLEDGLIEERLPRSSELARKSPLPGRRRPHRQVLLANVSLVAVVASLAEPRCTPFLTDRFLVIAEDAGIRTVLVLTKRDLVSEAYAETVAAPYRRAGYRVLSTSVLTQDGLEDLVQELRGEIAAFIGSSGVGKSSLVNWLCPLARLRVGDVNRAQDRGRHTTTVGRLIEWSESSWIADTPGLREVDAYDLDPQRLAWLFPEFRPLLQRGCRFSGCLHRIEPDCAVREAVQQGEIAGDRYGSYLRLLRSLL